MRKMCLLIGTGSQVSDVAHEPLVSESWYSGHYLGYKGSMGLIILLPHCLSDCMMSRLNLILWKQIPDNKFTYLYTKPWKLYRMQGLKLLYFDA